MEDLSNDIINDIINQVIGLEAGIPRPRGSAAASMRVEESKFQGSADQVCLEEEQTTHDES